MNRLDFIGLNANESASVLLYCIAVLWVLNLPTRLVYAKTILLVVEAGLIVVLGMTASRSGVVALVCGTVVVWWVRGHVAQAAESARISPAACLRSNNGQARRPALRWFSVSPIWRVLLVFAHPWMWSRSTPGYLAHDASIGNRFELWKGALKLIATDPLRGWGQPNTGAAYMNWFQSVDNHTYYRGLVNSYLQLAAAFGLPALGGVLFVGLLAMMGVWRFSGRACSPSAPKTSNDKRGGLGETALPRNLKKSLWFLGFLWLLIWGINSCFSTMLGNWMLLAPPLVAVPVMLVIQPLAKREFFWAFGFSVFVCVVLFVAGWLLARGDPVAIKRDGDGMVTVVAQGAPDTSPAFFPSRAGARRSQTCVVFVDEAALGEEFGKEVRKFALGSNFKKCLVVDKARYSTILGEHMGPADLIILSGNTVGLVEVGSGAAKYVLLNPAFLPGNMPSDPVQAIVYPEINRGHYLEPEASVMNKFRSKIRKIPFNESFETSWAKYMN